MPDCQYRVLLSGPDKFILNTYRTLLESRKFRCHCLAGGENIETVFSRFKADIVLLEADFAMQPDDQEIIRRLHEKPERLHIPVLLLDNNITHLNKAAFINEVLLQIQHGRSIARYIKTLSWKDQPFLSIANTLSDAVITINPQGRIVFWNKGAEHLLGYNFQEMVNPAYYPQA